jgi:transcriptional regulator GlxA family with amidase domain
MEQEGAAASDSSSMDDRVRHALRLISEDLRRPLALEEVARSVNLSETRLRSLFMAETDVTPAQHMKPLRIQKPKELLEETFLNVKQVMFEVGISDQRHCARESREMYGRTPTEYRKSVRG